ncbi:MAG: CehA/McbA family metallohydrolase [Hungatella sp.]|nr:CehA/McbA family metallohydrolase [Hungatella sp.]
MGTKELIFERVIKKEEEGTYFPVEFQVPEHVEELELSYAYTRFEQREYDNGETVKTEVNIVDLGVCAAGNRYIGSSGSDRTHIVISPYGSSQGFAPSEIEPGTWSVIAGAYKIKEGGCRVEYRVVFHLKQRKLYRGDTHIHTIGSDGNLSLEELALTARKEELDYVVITDHNNYAQNHQLPHMEGLTMIPGCEWTHYMGHAGILGAKRPFDNPFCVNSRQEMERKFAEAREQGAIVVLNHPFCPSCGWRWGMEETEYNLVEVWNGATPAAVNRKCLDWWDGKLKEGMRIPVIGGSDFHRLEYGRMPASPCTCLYSWSRTEKDLMEAMAAGHGFVVYGPEGPMASGHAGGKIFGDVISPEEEVHFHFWKLRTGDEIRLISDKGEEVFEVGSCVTEFRCSHKMQGLKYLRAEIKRRGIPAGEMPALLTNPFYIKGEEA